MNNIPYEIMNILSNKINVVINLQIYLNFID